MANNNAAWQVLAEANLVKGPMPESGDLESPWYVKVILAWSGWAASLFFLSFLGMGFFRLQNTVVAFFVGSGMLIGSYLLLKTTKGSVFVEHTALAMSLAGQVLIGWLFFDLFTFDGSIFWLTLALFQGALSIVMPSFIHGVMSSLFAALALSIGLSFAGVSFLTASILMAVAVLIWLYEFNHTQYIKRKSAIGYGLVLALIVIKSLSLFGLNVSQWHRSELAVPVMPWVGEVLLGVVMLYLVWKILERLGHHVTSPVSIAVLGGALLLSLASIEAQGITVGLAVLLLGFANSNKVLMGLGVASLLFYISSYYYLLDNTLMEKSQTMMIVGLLLLAIRWVIKRAIDNHKLVQHG